MGVIDDLLASLPDGSVQDVVIGAYKTAVVVDRDGVRRCGLASTPRDNDHHYGGGPAIRGAGTLLSRSARDLSEMARSDSPAEAAVGIATVNALLQEHREHWEDLNAEDVIAVHGRDRRVALVGHFPFVSRLREHVGTLWVLEAHPRDEDLPVGMAGDIIPQADVLAITGTTLINHTYERLTALLQPDAFVIVLGPSTPLSPILFDHRADVLSGAVVENVDAVLLAIRQGANFMQARQRGVRLVTMRAGRR
jgi:hypothetical protein